mgnify:CR=1 FL=1
MSWIWIALLLKALEWVLQYLLSQKQKGNRLTDAEVGKLNDAIAKAYQLETVAVAMGCKRSK